MGLFDFFRKKRELTPWELKHQDILIYTNEELQSASPRKIYYNMLINYLIKGRDEYESHLSHQSYEKFQRFCNRLSEIGGRATWAGFHLTPLPGTWQETFDLIREMIEIKKLCPWSTLRSSTTNESFEAIIDEASHFNPRNYSNESSFYSNCANEEEENQKLHNKFFHDMSEYLKEKLGYGSAETNTQTAKREKIIEAINLSTWKKRVYPWCNPESMWPSIFDELLLEYLRELDKKD